MNTQHELYSRGEIAKRSRVNSETIRYYEKIGIMPKPPRSEAGYRLYDGEHYCLLYTSPSPRDATLSRMPSSA